MKPVMRCLFLAVVLVLSIAVMPVAAGQVPLREDIDAAAYGIQDAVDKFPGLYDET